MRYSQIFKPDLFLSFLYNTDTSGMVKTARKAKSIPLSLGCKSLVSCMMQPSKPHKLWLQCREGCFHNSIHTAASAEAGKQSNPSHKARAHCWLRAVQANMLRGTVTFPVPPMRTYQAVSCSVSCKPSCCTQRDPKFSCLHYGSVSLAQAISAWECLWSKYRVLADRR